MQSQNKTNYYEILGVSRTATQDEIKKAFRMLVKKYHPDVNPNPNANEMMKNITIAYEVLSDVSKRKEYDRQHSYEPYFDSSKSYYSYNESREESESDFDEWIIDLLKKHRMYNENDTRTEMLLKARRILFHSNNPNFTYASFVRRSEDIVDEKVKVKKRY